MWKHEIMPDHSIMMVVTPEMQDKNNGRWSETIKKLKSQIQDAQFFFFGDLIKSNLWEQRNSLADRHQKLPFFNAPYEYTVFEYTIEDSFQDTENGLNKSTKRMIFIHQDGDEQIFIPLAFMNNGILNIKKPCLVVHPYCMSLNKSEELKYMYGSIFEGLESAFEEESQEDLMHDVFHEFSMGMFFLEVLNCQNVVTKDVLPPEKLNRKRIRKGKLPLYSYKILEVVKGKPKSKNAGEVPWDYKSPESVRFHLCRGHFKTFTEDKPLFGKYSGTFWWNPQSRGDRSKGVVEKEYSVKIA